VVGLRLLEPLGLELFELVGMLLGEVDGLGAVLVGME
jgi:hypothetical protein